MNNKVSFDAMLQMAARESVYRQLNAIPPKKELEKLYTVSDAHQKKINRIIKNENIADKLIKFNRQFSKVAVILLVAFTVTFTPLISAQAVRESIVQTIIEWKEEFASIFFKSENAPAVINDVKIGYMVEGFESDGPNYQGDYEYRETFTLGDKHINVSILSENRPFSIHTDNEYSNYYSIIVDGNSGVWVCDGNYYSLVINKGAFVYKVEGHTDIGRIIDIYKNIEIF